MLSFRDRREGNESHPPLLLTHPFSFIPSPCNQNGSHAWGCSLVGHEPRKIHTHTFALLGLDAFCLGLLFWLRSCFPVQLKRQQPCPKLWQLTSQWRHLDAYQGYNQMVDEVYVRHSLFVWGFYFCIKWRRGCVASLAFAILCQQLAVFKGVGVLKDSIWSCLKG